jgi:hypothetical protein
MFGTKLPRPRGFEFKPRFYEPEPDEDEGRIHFQRILKSPPAQKGSTFRLLVLFIALFLIFLYLYRAGGSASSHRTGDDAIKVEEIIVVE